MEERRFPAALESEKRALGAILNDHQEPITELDTEDFYDNALSRAYTAARQLSEEGLAITPVSVHERSNVALEDLQSLRDKASGITNTEVQGLIKEIQRVSQIRKLYRTARSITENISKDSSLEELAQEVEKSLYSLDRDGSREARDGADVLRETVNGVLERFGHGGGVEVSTGLKAMDKAIIGLRPGKMMVIAARPAMGKTALADTIRRAVLEQGYGAIQFSLEMPAEEILEREIAFRAQTNLRKIMSGKDLSDDELERVRGAVGTGIPGHWFIDDSTYSISGMRRRARILARRMARQGVQLGVVVLDYIQLAGDNGDGREQSVAAISRGCKLMAKELGCTVLALSQLNRACETRDDKRPLMSDLRESGAIEQDADIVAFVYRESQYDFTYPPDEAELIIRKHRGGPTGTIKLHFNGKMTSFADVPESRHSRQLDTSVGTGNQEVGS